MSSHRTKKPKLIAIVGPNSSGKTSISIKLAKKYHGEIISADSRQVYKGMDIGTGKATKKEQSMVSHHLLDISSPTKLYNVSHFKKDAENIIQDIYKRGKLPMLVGGTGFWIQAVINDINLPNVKPNTKLRKQLERKSITQLFIMLKKLDPQRTKTIDKQNPYRLIRAIEICRTTKKPIPLLNNKSPYDVLMLGIKHDLPKLKKRIDIRLDKRFKQGMIAEVKKLHRNGVSWKKMEDFGLEYRYISYFLQDKLTKEEMTQQLRFAIYHYAKRQLTWFNKDKRVYWIKNQKQAEQLITKLIK
ncbi:MAG: tRNA (adenosine(37)-N6)-dimethylallyltransferase MiaA [bacterium]|nr:tRNA (adenosine(37)-N6)-dimethylallyltransferase MiaA [bacterium]